MYERESMKLRRIFDIDVMRYPVRLVSYLLVIDALLISFQSVSGEQICAYHDEFNRPRYKTCTTGCCGDYHRAYCCINRHLGEIAAGSIGGFILLVSLVCLTVCCYRRLQRRHEDRSLRPTLEGVQTYGAAGFSDISEQQEPHSSSSLTRQNPKVWLTVTPPTPTQLGQEQIYQQQSPASTQSTG